MNIQRILCALILLLAARAAAGQSAADGVKLLSRQAADSLFTDSVKQAMGIIHPVYRVYQYADQSGMCWIVLTESRDSIIRNRDTTNSRIRAYSFRHNKTGLVKQWEINDFTVMLKGSDCMERSIWFWTRYCEFRDLDDDGLTDPLLVYGSSGINGTDDGRVKILLFYKGRKVVIRHQNGGLDEQRSTCVDDAFYRLPSRIQEHVKMLMHDMTDHGNAVFPYGWQQAMQAGKRCFDEKGR